MTTKSTSSNSNQTSQNESSGKNKQGSSTQGGTHEQHVKAGQQSHKNTDDKKRSDQDRDRP